MRKVGYCLIYLLFAVVAAKVNACPDEEKVVPSPTLLFANFAINVEFITDFANFKPLSQKAEKSCNQNKREAFDNPTYCCTKKMLEDIHFYRRRAIEKVNYAIRALKNPDRVAQALKNHFSVAANDTARIAVIKARLQDVLNSINGDNVRYYCRDKDDNMCRMTKIQRRAVTENCSSSPTVRMWFCAEYEEDSYFPDETWQRTFIHEHVHAGCKIVGEVETDKEIYQLEKNIYPPVPDLAIKNPDSYAHFIFAIYRK